MLDLIIIGAGPFGISLAASAVQNGLSYKLFGYPMDFWKNKMPQDMFIRTPHEFIDFSVTDADYSITKFAEETNTEVVTPLPRPIFVQYAMWFANKHGVTFTNELVQLLQYVEGAYHILSETGEEVKARNVIIATGVEHYKYMPDLYKHLPANLVSHTSGYTDFTAFKGEKVAVIGSGQSAWEAAGLLHREGAQAELLYRREVANYAGSREAEIFLRDLGDVFYQLPLNEKKDGWGQAPGSVAHFLKPFVDGMVKETGSTTVTKVEVTDNQQVKLVLSTGEERIVDHIISASGFRINVDKVPFLSDDMKVKLDREDGYTQFPKLNEEFESNLPGLYFAGPLASHSHGPTFRFILGTKKAATTIIPSIVSKQVVQEIL